MLAVAAPATAEVPAGDSPEAAQPSAPPATTPSPPPPAGPTPPSEAPPVAVPPPPTVPSTATPVFLPPKEPGAPPTGTFSLHPSVTAYEEYSDNFRLSSGGKKQENYRTTIAPGAALDINGAFTTGRIAYTLSGAYDTSENDVSLFHSLLGLISWRPTPQFTLTVSDVLTRSDVPEAADRLTLRRQRVTFTSNAFFAGSEYHIGRIVTTESYRLSTFSDQGGADTTSHTLAATIGTSFYGQTSASAGYTYLTSSTSSTAGSSPAGSSTSGAFTTSGHTVTATIARQLNVRTSAGLSGSYTSRTSSGPGSAALSSGAFVPGTFGSVAFGAGAFGDYTIWNVTAFNAYTSGPLSLSGSLGFSRLMHGSQSFDSVASQTTAVYRFVAGALATVGFDSGFSETFAQGQNFGVIQTRGVTASFFYPLTSLLTSQVTGFYRQNETTGVGNGPSGFRSDSWGTTLAMTYQVARNVNLGLDYRHTEVSGQGLAAFGQASAGSGYAENRIRLLLGATF